MFSFYLTSLFAAPIPLWPASDQFELEGVGPLGLEGKSPMAAPYVFVDTISITIGALTLVAFIWFIFLIFIGAIGIMTGGGDKTKVAEARSKITYGLIGLVIIISAIFIAQLIATVLGLNTDSLLQTIKDLGP